MDPRWDMERIVYCVRGMGCMGRLEESGLVGVVAADCRRFHNQVHQLQLVAQVQGHEADVVHGLLVGGRDCVCFGSGVFY